MALRLEPYAGRRTGCPRVVLVLEPRSHSRNNVTVVTERSTGVDRLAGPQFGGGLSTVIRLSNAESLLGS